MRTVWVDANVLLRLLTNEPTEHAKRAEKLFRLASQGDLVLLIPAVVIAEVVWALASFYRYEGSEIADGLRALVVADGVAVEAADAILDAFTLMVEQKVDFADAYLAAVATRRGEEVASFDDDLRRLGARVFAF